MCERERGDERERKLRCSSNAARFAWEGLRTHLKVLARLNPFKVHLHDVHRLCAHFREHVNFLVEINAAL